MLKTWFLTLLTPIVSVDNYVDNYVEIRGQGVNFRTLTPVDPSLKFSLWGQKCKFDPYKKNLEGSKNRGQKAPLKRGLFDPPAFEPHPLRARWRTMNILAHESEIKL